MEDCDSQVLLDWIAASRKLKLPDKNILDSVTEMLDNISKDTRVRIAQATAAAANAPK